MTEALRSQLWEHLSPLPRLEALAIGKAAGVPGRAVGAAIARRPINAECHLRLCAALGVDPAPDLKAPRAEPGPFDHLQMAMGFKMRRMMNGHSVRAAGKVVGISGFTVSRLENGHLVSIGVVVRACRYIGVHPFGYLRVGHTWNTHSNALSSVA
jgi:hypothetical protein